MFLIFSSRSAYNPLICWWDAVNWFFYGFFHNVLGPDAIQCGAAQVLIDAGCVLTQLFDSLLVFLAGGKFLTGFYDMSKLSAAIVQFVDSWTMMLCCLCQVTGIVYLKFVHSLSRFF